MSVLTLNQKQSEPPTKTLLGIPLALTTYDQTIAWIAATVEHARATSLEPAYSVNAPSFSSQPNAHHSTPPSKAYICVAAVHTVMAAREDPELRHAVLNANFTVPDGRPLVWALRLLGHPLPDRVYGPELMARACARAAQMELVGSASEQDKMNSVRPVSAQGKVGATATQAPDTETQAQYRATATKPKFYLYGGRDQAALDLLQQKLTSRYPGLNIVGSYCPPFRPLTPNEEEQIANDINSSQADIVWVGIGVPKQEKWMARMRPLLDAPVLIGVGAAFDFHAGLIPQAPPWMQRAGLEWLYRLSREPRRLWRRYLRYNPWFVAAFARQLVRERVLPTR